MYKILISCFKKWWDSMTNKEYLDYLRVCKGIDFRKIERRMKKVENSSIDITSLIKVGMENRENEKLDQLFFSLTTLIEGLEYKNSLDIVNKIAESIITAYRTYNKYRCNHHSPHFYFDALTYNIGIELASEKCNIADIIHKFNLIQIESNDIFYIQGTEYRFMYNALDELNLYKHGNEIVQRDIYGVYLKDNNYRLIMKPGEIKEDADFDLLMIKHVQR